MTHEALAHIKSALSGLTDFQRATVDAINKSFKAKDGQGARVLVADEVGLGKTLVARGVVAQLLGRWLQVNPKRPMRVVYICSNQALARENAEKLAIFRDEALRKRWLATPTFDRLADLGIEPAKSQPGVVLELCLLTPATSFALTNGDGTARERHIIWKALRQDRYIEDTKKLEAFFRNNVVQSWDDAKELLREKKLEENSLKAFHSRLSTKPELHARHKKSVLTLGLNDRSWRTLLCSASELKKNDISGAAWVRSRIRGIFVECCAQNLKADLFILDEFQRFRDLLTVAKDDLNDETPDEKRSEQQIIAQKVLHQDGAYNTLLLSATPFKALTHVKDEEEGKAHAQELDHLMQYLTNKSERVVNSLRDSRQELLLSILSLPDSPLQPNSLDDKPKQCVEQILRAYIFRTERGQLLSDNQKVLEKVQEGPISVSAAEIASFVSLDRLTEALKKTASATMGADIMPFFKATPWCLSFLNGYQLHEALKKEKNRSVPDVKTAIKELSDAWIPVDAFNSYKLNISTSAPSARLRQLVEVAVPQNAERMLWTPASLPAYQNEGPFAGNEGFSKTLLFSALVLAPRALSSMVSYEVERRLQPKGKKHGKYFGDRTEESGTFRFEATSMSPAWSLVYPGLRLADACALTQNETLGVIRAKVRKNLEVDFLYMVDSHGSVESLRGSKWYTLAPFLLDKTAGNDAHTLRWLNAIGASKELGEGHRGQLSRIRQALYNPLNLGKPPEDLLDYLVDLAIAGPGICLYRALEKVWPGSMSLELGTSGKNGQFNCMPLGRCAEAALGFVAKMNRIESQRVLRAVCPGAKPWTGTARYSAMGNLQSVLDEYAHLLKSGQGEINHAITTLKTSLAVGAVTVSAQTRLPLAKAKKEDEVRFHCHYAVPLGNQKSSDEKSLHRITNIRAAFNSPFWPFMLNSTSIGQEGLDFHWYCRRVVHWSLPSNPIDLEQREGRVNRYKSLVVRQRAAELYVRKQRNSVEPDIWTDVFNVIKGSNTGTDLVPYWHVPGGSAHIERMVPAMPFSTEIIRLDEILRILSLYRLAFGQPRQQELVENLLKRNFTDDDIKEIKRALLIDLAPISYLK